MRNLTLSIIINAITDGARQGLRQTRQWLDELGAAGARVSAYLMPLFMVLWTQITSFATAAFSSIAAGFSWMSSAGAASLALIRAAFAPVFAGLSGLAAYAATLVPPGFFAMAAGVSGAMAAARAAIVGAVATAIPALSSLAMTARTVAVAGFGAMAAGVTAVMMRVVGVVSAGVTAIDASIVGIAAAGRAMAVGLATTFAPLGALFTGLAAQVRGYLGPIITLLGAWKITQVASDFEQLEIRLNGAFDGIKQKSANAFQWIKQFAVNTVYSVRQTTDAFLTLKGFGFDPMDGSLRKVGDAAAKWGRDAASMISISVQLGQALARAKLQVQDMNILIDNGVPVIGLLEKALGKSSAEIMKMSENGELGRDVIRQLIEEMGKQSAGMMAERMKSLSGAVSNMGDAFDNAIDNIRKKGGFQWITDSVKTFTSVIPDLVTTVADMGQSVAAVFGEIFAVVGAVFNGIDSVINIVMGQNGSASSAISGFIKLLKSIQVIVLAVRTGFEVSFDAIKTTLADFANGLITVVDIADKLLHLDFSGAIEAWNKGFADLKAIVAGGGQDIIDAATKGRTDMDNVWKPKDALKVIQDNPQQPLPLGDTQTNPDLKDKEKAIKATLDFQLNAIKNREEALKDAHDLELKQLESTFNAQKLQLEQQVVEQKITEQQKNEQTLALTKDLNAKKITLEAQFIEQSKALEKAAIVAKIQAEQAQAPDGAYSSLINAAQQQYNLPDGLVRAVMQVESGGNPNAVSPAGAKGLMQLMPETAKGLGVKDVFDPKQNIEGGAKLLRELLDTFNGDVDKALAAYNANPATVKAAKGDAQKLPAETQAYVYKVRAELQNPTGSGTVEERQASAAKIKTLNNELVATEQDRVAQLKSLGIDEQNATVEQSTAELEIKKTTLTEQKALKEEQLQAEHDAALDAVAVQEQAAQQELDIGNITASEHLDRLKEFAADRLAIELKLLEEKRKLLKDDKLALAQNLDEQKALMRKFGLDVKNINNDLATNNKAIFEGMFAPFQNALQQMTNGVLTGQQTITNAVRNAANSILVSYASTFIKERALQVAHWAWKQSNLVLNQEQEQALKNGDVIWTVMLAAKEKAVLAAHWTWEQLGFAKKEATKQTISQHGVITETLLSAKKKVVWAAEWAWETVGFGLKEARKRALSLATGAWETLLSAKKKIVLAAEWVWETLGFGAKEIAKTESKLVSETAQTGAQVAGDAIRTASAVTAEGTKKAVTADAAESSIMSKAYDAAAGVYASLAGIPYVGWILAPVAAAATFLVVAGWSAMAGSAEKGEMEVAKDGSPFILHKKESVLPAHVADNFRKVVDFVKRNLIGEPSDIRKETSATGTSPGNQRTDLTERLAASARTLTESVQTVLFGRDEKTILPENVHELISAMVASGQLKTGWTVPADIINFPQQSAEQAATMAQSARQANDRLMTERLAALQPVTQQTITHHHEGNVHMPVYAVDDSSVKKLFHRNSDTIARIARDKLKSGKMLKS